MNILSTIKQWHIRNRKYDGFVWMEWYTIVSLLMLAGNIIFAATDVTAWSFFTFNTLLALCQAARWQSEKRLAEFKDFVHQLLGIAHNATDVEHARLVSANRRRKRAERSLKWYIKALSHELDMSQSFERKIYEYEQMLLMARHAILDNNQLARDRFLAFMQEHPDIVIRVASREYVEGMQECIFMGDAKPPCFDGFMSLLQESENDYKQKAEEVLLTVPLATVQRVSPSGGDDRGVIEQLQAIASDALYIGRFEREEKDISDMVGKTFSQVIANEDSLIFANDTEAYLFFHIQDCCESVTIDDICGELSDLAGTSLVKAEEVSDSLDRDPTEEYDESYTWTFYKFATAKGYVDVRWYGTSNGYYSESVDLCHFPIKDGKLIRKE